VPGNHFDQRHLTVFVILSRMKPFSAMLALAIAIPATLRAQVAPSLRWSAGYASEFGGSGYGLESALAVLTPSVGVHHFVELDAAIWYDRTGIVAFSVIKRSTVGAGPVLSFHTNRAPSGFDLFAGATVQFLHSSNESGVFLDNGGISTAPPPANQRGTAASSLGLGVQLGLTRRFSDQFGVFVATTLLHQSLYDGASSSLSRFQAGFIMGLR
jgi:hypothetical protein